MIRMLSLSTLLFSTVVLSAACTSCESNTPATEVVQISLSHEHMEFAKDGGSQQLDVVAPREWSAFADAE